MNLALNFEFARKLVEIESNTLVVVNIPFIELSKITIFLKNYLSSIIRENRKIHSNLKISITISVKTNNSYIGINNH